MTDPASTADPRLHARVRAAEGDLWLSAARSGTVIAGIAHRSHAARSYEAYIAAIRSAHSGTDDPKEHR